MIEIFYKTPESKFESTNNLEMLKTLQRENVLWLDLCDPEGEEKRAVEAYLNTTR